MTKYVKVYDARLHGGSADVAIENSAVHIYSSAGYQILNLNEVPADLIKKIRDYVEQLEDVDLTSR